MPENTLYRRQAVGRKLHDKRCRFAPQHRLSQKDRGKERKHDAAQVNCHNYVGSVSGEKCPCKQHIDRQLCTATHKRYGKNRRNSILRAFECPGGHNCRHRTAKAEDHWHKRLAMQAETMQDSVSQKCRARHVTCVFHDGNA